MDLRSRRFITLCGGFLALTLVGLQLAGCGLTGEPAASIPGFAFVKKNQQGYPEYTHEKTGIVFVRLPGNATLDSFLIAKHEVTQ